MSSKLNNEKRQKIEQLAKIAHEKREIYKYLGMLNTPIDPELNKKRSIEYAISYAELVEAEKNLNKEINK